MIDSAAEVEIAATALFESDELLFIVFVLVVLGVGPGVSTVLGDCREVTPIVVAAEDTRSDDSHTSIIGVTVNSACMILLSTLGCCGIRISV